MIVRAPATQIATFVGFLGPPIDGLVYRIECVVDQGRTTQFEEPHTARGGFENIELSTTKEDLGTRHRPKSLGTTFCRT